MSEDNMKTKKNTVEVNTFLILILFFTLVALLGTAIYFRNEVNKIESCVIANVSEEVVEPVLVLNETEEVILNETVLVELNETVLNETLINDNINISIN